VRIFSNSAMSADGKIATREHDHVAIGSAEDRRMMSVLRAQADAVLVGGQTFRNWPLPLVEELRHREGGRQRPMINAVLTRRGLLGRGQRWPDPRVELHIYGGPELDAAAHSRELGAQVHQAENMGVAEVLADLEARGCESVLIEGGGALIFEVAALGRLQELYITVCPLLIGGRESPTPLDGLGFSAATAPRLRLLEARVVEAEVYLRYGLDRAL
jgi:5-amino-6-(5-phosphoribosylamino)uracil reductase